VKAALEIKVFVTANRLLKVARLLWMSLVCQHCVVAADALGCLDNVGLLPLPLPEIVLLGIEVVVAAGLVLGSLCRCVMLRILSMSLIVIRTVLGR
jgi:hypothetical protein